MLNIIALIITILISPDLSSYPLLSTSMGHYIVFLVENGSLPDITESNRVFYSSQRHVIIEMTEDINSELHTILLTVSNTTVSNNVLNSLS